MQIILKPIKVYDFVKLLLMYNTFQGIRRFLSLAPSLSKGHSKWQNIKATKTKNDDAKSKKIIFFLKKMKVIVRAGGFDPKFNKKLFDLEKDYVKESLPLDTFHRHLQQCKVF